MKDTKTNAMRMLDAAGISYTPMTYTVDEDDLSGTHIADEIGLPPEQVFKTLVARGDRQGISVFCIPSPASLDLKAAARLTGDKKIEMVPVKELLGLTGYIRGGCSPIGMKKPYPVYMDETCILFDRITVSSGMRGIQLLLSPDELIPFVHAELASLTVD